MGLSEWETILLDVLHATRSLLCTATNTTPHERLFNFTRKSTAGKSIPSWIKPGLIYVKNHRRTSKNEPMVIEATLLDANPHYAHIRLASGTETTVNIRDIAPHHESIDQSRDNRISVCHLNDENSSLNENTLLDTTRSDMINDTNNTDVMNVNCIMIILKLIVM